MVEVPTWPKKTKHDMSTSEVNEPTHGVGHWHLAIQMKNKFGMQLLHTVFLGESIAVEYIRGGFIFFFFFFFELLLCDVLFIQVHERCESLLAVGFG